MIQLTMVERISNDGPTTLIAIRQWLPAARSHTSRTPAAAATTTTTTTTTSPKAAVAPSPQPTAVASTAAPADAVAPRASQFEPTRRPDLAPTTTILAPPQSTSDPPRSERAMCRGVGSCHLRRLGRHDRREVMGFPGPADVAQRLQDEG